MPSEVCSLGKEEERKWTILLTAKNNKSKILFGFSKGKNILEILMMEIMIKKIMWKVVPAETNLIVILIKVNQSINPNPV
jgi:hypothetical protein